ncbi:heparinase II/III family protein [Pseudomonas lactucae]|uniref:Alginate lyase family protein n=1 Tax=Pseudomonas lactucae TaxID=2813360 RepID=A0A9X1C4Q2_9PSED|nr:heparinase II/III family protein [Pseudomonas lactucae]MBN2974887.1 alginate lyase family protein [Pseudomonas lactucae]MBN2988489.1 alginate lyase family protein [Pseudomonas lactucae]
MQRITKLYHTVKMLRLKQIFYRLYYRFANVRPFSAQGFTRRPCVHLANTTRWNASRFNADEQFEFMGLTAPIDWHDETRPKIWQYNLHYLDHLASSDQTRTDFDKRLVNSWIANNPPFSGCGWEPYTLSLRIVNLIKWQQQQPTLEPHWLDSLATQAHALSEQVEYHILANHLFVNGKALVFAGSFLHGQQADDWLSKGLKILDEEIEEQFLADGAHFELSPMYHASLLWDMCDLLNLATHSELPELTTRQDKWRGLIERGLAWLRSLQHPDGGIPFFNDCAFGIAPTLLDIEAYAVELGCHAQDKMPDTSAIVVEHQAASGYVAINFGNQCKALLNLAQVAPDYQPGHTHADTLSFELSLFGQRVFVNSGTSQYGEGAERHRQRSTAAHNTIEVNGESSSQVWAGFRVARRARTTVGKIEQTADTVRISSSHDGYLRLAGKNVHTREWLATGGQLQVMDFVSGTFDKAVSRLFLHPDVSAVQQGNTISITLPGGQVAVATLEGATRIHVVPSTWHPEFGKSVPNQCIVAEISTDRLTTCITW